MSAVSEFQTAGAEHLGSLQFKHDFLKVDVALSLLTWIRP